MIIIEPKLKIESVSLDYEAQGSLVHALRDVSLYVNAGESVAIIGPSGCGKSSLLSVACGLVKPTSGEVLVDGEILAAPRRNTSLVQQDFGLLPWKNVIDNCALGAKVRGVTKRERYEMARSALGAVHLNGYDNAFPSQLSGGMKQRLALARAIALDADLLLLDEPMSALDALLREEIQGLLLSLWVNRGYAQVIVTHSIEEAVLLGQRIFVLGGSPGELIATIDNPHSLDLAARTSKNFQDMCESLRSMLSEIQKSKEAVAS